MTDVALHALDGNLLIRVPPEPPMDSIVIFRKFFTLDAASTIPRKPGGYIYVGIRTDIGWFFTSRAQLKGCTWLQVVKFACYYETEQPKMLLASDFTEL